MVQGVVALHSSDPLTPHLACWARTPAFVTEDLDRALCETRTLWRLHAMRRTLFVVAAHEAGMFLAAVGRDIAATERRRIEAWVADAGPADDVQGFMADLESEVVDVLADGGEWRTQELSAALPGLATEISVGSGRWATRVPLSSRLLFLLALEGRIVRTRPAGTWRSSQYRWAAASSWFAHPPANVDPANARAELARRYLDAYGPVTVTDVRWWTGWTAKHTTQALHDVGAVPVDLDSGGEGLVLPDDVGPQGADASGEVAFLPGLDSTPMGWKDRAWYLGPHGDRLFDRNGNVGPSIWADGRVVGGWAQRTGGEVVWRLLDDVGADITERVVGEAATLTEWMGGVVATPRFRTPLERELSV